MPPATGIFDKAFLSRRQRRNQIPNHRTVALARQFVATDIRAVLTYFPDPHLVEQPAAPRAQAERV